MTSKEFEDLIKVQGDYTSVEQEKHDIGGGIITNKEIDEINNLVDVKKIMISGLRQDTFEYFVRTQAYKFKAIMFWKNKLVEDWSLLSTLKNVQFIGYFHNQRITKFWDMTNNISLEGLYISDFTRLKSLEGIEKAPRLERLYFGNAVWSTSVLKDIKPLENSKIKEFSFGGKKIEDEDISIYTKIPKLERLDFPTNMYKTEQLAWLVAKMPNVKGYALRPYVKFDRNTTDNEDIDDILICGKRKPFLSSDKDSERIKRYINKFEALVKQYQDENNNCC